jgi:hypothetical protein
MHHRAKTLSILLAAWVAVTAGLPPCSQKVLVNYFGTVGVAWRYCPEPDRWVWLEVFEDRAIFEPEGIWHWMPLPKEAEDPPDPIPRYPE